MPCLDYPGHILRATFQSVSKASEKRAALKRWLRDRLTRDERAREDWHQLWEATWDHLLLMPVHDLIDENTAKALVDRLLDPEVVTELSRPIAVNVARALIAELRKDRQPVERFTPQEARDRLQAALARPGLVHPDWVHATLRGEAVEAVLNDALYRALRDFSTLIPRIMVKMPLMRRFSVLGSAGALAEKLIGEVEKFVEPEIRSFLSDSTGRVLESAAEFTIAKIDDPAQIEFRATFIDFVLSRSPAFLLQSADDELIEEMGAAAELTARHIANAPETREAMRGWIDRVMDYCADKTLGEALELGDSGARPPIDSLADATWPAFMTIVAGPGVQSWVDELVDELIDEFERSDSQ